MTKRGLSVKERGQLYEKMCKCIVCLRDDAIIIGGGVFVEDNSRQMVLSAAHIVLEKKNLNILSFDGKSYKVQLRGLNRAKDVALLDIVDAKSEERFPCAELLEKGSRELVRSCEIHMIGHPGRQRFSYNIGHISCIERTCHDIYVNDFMGLNYENFPSEVSTQFIDDFRGLASSLRLIQVKNMHGGGRFGGTGAPLLNGDGKIVGLYSFTFKEDDYGVHVDEIRQVMKCMSN